MVVRELYIKGIQILKDCNILDADIDARYLLMDCLNCSTAQFYSIQHNIVDDNIVDNYLNLIKKRSTHYPLQYILGTQEFMGLEFNVNEDVLIPRQETELLVEQILNNNLENKSVLDMCTGSGCIAISIKKLSKYNVDVKGVDISELALKVAKHNAICNNVDVDFVNSDLFNNVTGQYDIIVSNPPYIRKADIMELMEEVKNYEPIIALDGTEDGLYFYRKITEYATRYLNKNGMLYYEIGYDQADEVTSILKNNNFNKVNVIKDFAGLDRIVYGTYQSSGLE